MIIDSAIYANGKSTAELLSLQETYEACRERRGLAWIGLYRPTEEEFSSVAKEFGLHELAVEDAIKAHQRPKLERYADTLFVVLRPLATSTSLRRWSSGRRTSSWALTSL